jgi:hypothetical protein
VDNDYYWPPDLTLKMKRDLFFRTAAARWIDFQPVHGQLVLSGGKLSFLCADPECKSDLSIQLDTVDKVDYFKKISYNQHALLLFKKDGSIEHFSVKDRREWKDKITRHLQGKF